MGNLTAEELAHCDSPLTDNWKKEYSYAGGFQTALMEVIERADNINLRKLSQIYPNLVNLYKKWSGKNG